MSVIWSSGMSVTQGLQSEWRDSWNFCKCLSYSRCLLLRGVHAIVRGSTVCVHSPSLVARPVGTWE